MSLSQNSLNDFSMDIRETEVATAVTEGKPLMVQAHQVENGRMEVVDMDAIFDRLKPNSSVAP